MKRLNELNIESILTKEEKKRYGIFFTPNDIVECCYTEIGKYIDWSNVKNVCEPSSGTGAFIDPLNDDIHVDAYELHDQVFKVLSDKYKSNENIKTIHQDYLTTDVNIKYDLIVGNPPYFVNVGNDMYKGDYFVGRSNIFIQFIVHSLLKLNNDGILCFVIPSTFLNCSYYTLTCEFIKNNFEILNIWFNNDSFKYTKYSTITLLIRKPKVGSIVDVNNNSINNSWFYNNVIIVNEELKQLINSPHKTLKDIKGVKVSVGSFI